MDKAKGIYTRYTPNILGVYMVSAMIEISEHANRVLNIIKAKNGLRDKSEAIERMALEYEEEILELAFKPEFVEKIKKAEKSKKFRKIKDIKELFK